MPASWTFQTSGELVFGSGSLDQVGRRVALRGIRRVLVVTDQALCNAGHAEHIQRSFSSANISSAVFDGGHAEPSIDVALRAIDVARQVAPDAVLGLGGGSNIDVAKVTALVATHGAQPRDYFGFDNIPGPVLPIIAVPTTAGTGSEVSNSGVLTDTQQSVKVSTLSNHLRPTLAVVDPCLALSCPRQVTADSGIDALTHAIEAYTAVDAGAMQIGDDEKNPYSGRHPLGDCLAEKAIQLIGKHLRTAVQDGQDLPAREGMALAATLAGMAFSNCGVALVHALEYPIGGAIHCSHGAGNGLLLPYVMRFNLPQRRGALARIAVLLGEDVSPRTEHEAALRAIEAVERLRRDIGIPHKLRELGAHAEQLPDFAHKALQIKRLLQVNPRQANEEDLLGILQAAF